MKPFEKFTKHQIKLLLRHLRNFDQATSSESLHLIRVDIKKIKAILRAVGYSDHTFNAHKPFIPFRTIFRRAGQIREREVIARLLEQYQVRISIKDLKSMVDLEKNLIGKFEDDVPRFLRTIRKHAQDVEDASKGVKQKDMETYLKKRKKDVKSGLHPYPQFSTIHKTRKTIKEIIYLSAPLDGLRKKEVSFYKQAESTAGRLHDKQILINYLKDRGKMNSKQFDLIVSGYHEDKKEIARLAQGFY